MTKTIKIEGMSCGHCTAAVEKALRELEAVSDVVVDLDKKTAVVTLTAELDDTVLDTAVSDIGFDVAGIV